MITIALCDDNTQFACLLRQHLQRLCAYNIPNRVDISIAPTFSSADEVLEYLQSNTIDILFLDIDMPKTNGFELAKALCDAHPDTIIIFVSSYEEFVYSSFEYCPFQFLRKAHLDKELEITLKRVIEKCVIGSESLVFDTTDGEILLRVRDILFFEGQKNYFYIYTAQSKVYKCRGTMKSVDALTEKYDFFRIHSAYIVNLEHIDNINSTGFLVMRNGKILSISKKRMQSFKGAYMEFIRRRVTR